MTRRYGLEAWMRREARREIHRAILAALLTVAGLWVGLHR